MLPCTAISPVSSSSSSSQSPTSSSLVKRRQNLGTVPLLKRKGEYYVGSCSLMEVVKVPIAPTHVYSINDSLLAEEAIAAEYEFVIRQLVRTQIVGVSEISDCPKFDLILLGMGSCGHVASLFPNHSVLNEKEEWVTESIKAEVVHRAINNVEGPSLPAKMVQPTNGKLALFLDKLVASKLDGGAQFSE